MVVDSLMFGLSTRLELTEVDDDGVPEHQENTPRGWQGRAFFSGYVTYDVLAKSLVQLAINHGGLQADADHLDPDTVDGRWIGMWEGPAERSWLPGLSRLIERNLTTLLEVGQVFSSHPPSGIISCVYYRPEGQDVLITAVWTLAEALARAGYDYIIGTFVFHLPLQVRVSSVARLERKPETSPT